MSYVPVTSLFGLAIIVSAILGSSAYLAIVQTIVADHRRSNSPDIDDSSY